MLTRVDCSWALSTRLPLIDAVPITCHRQPHLSQRQEPDQSTNRFGHHQSRFRCCRRLDMPRDRLGTFEPVMIPQECAPSRWGCPATSSRREVEAQGDRFLADL